MNDRPEQSTQTMVLEMEIDRLKRELERTDDRKMRLEALQIAARDSGSEDTESIVEIAEKYFAFLVSNTA